MALTDKNLTLKEAQQYLEQNGIDWSLGWIKIQVSCGKIPSTKIFSSRVIGRADLDKIIQEHRRKLAGIK